MEIMRLHEALAKVQQELNVPKGQMNDFGGYAYRSTEDILHAVKPLLKNVGATVTLNNDMVVVGDRVYAKSTATFTVRDGSIESNGFAREAETKKGMDVSQITGSASSYASKTALCGLFMIDDEKDADNTNDHGISLSYLGRMQTLKDKYPPNVIKIAMRDYKIQRLGEIPEDEFGSFEQLVEGLYKSQQEGEL